MTHPYLPLTGEERRRILEKLDLASPEDLFAGIPAEIRSKARLDLPSHTEHEVRRIFTKWAEKNIPASRYVSFLGAGAYEHAIPAAVGPLLGQSAFYTSYTPYQPEISQGMLQAIFEFQTLIAGLTGMDVANASLYDGPTALAEAVLLACAYTRRSKVLLFSGLNPEAEKVLHTYTRFLGIKVESLPYREERREELAAGLDDRTAAVVLQNPDFMGIISEIGDLPEIVHQMNALFIVYINDPVSLALLEAPGVYGVDLTVGEGQAFGLPLSFGGPYLGFFAARQELLRRLPGRIVGETVDAEGKRSFVLTLQAREQHIRRERATSNICSNQALCALAAVIYLALLGPEGLKETAAGAVRNSRYLYHELMRCPGVEPLINRPFFHEFPVRIRGDVPAITRRLKEKGFLAGFPLAAYRAEYAGGILLYTSELRTKEEMDRFCDELEGLLR